MAEKALKLSESIEYEKGITYAYSYLGFFWMIGSEYKKSLEYARLSNCIFEAIGDKLGMALVAFTVGSVHYKTDETHLGLKYLLNSLEL